MKAFDDVKKYVNENPSILEWYNAFEQAKRIKTMVWSSYQYRTDAKKTDKRMDRVWKFVKSKEHFLTFIDGELSSKARYYLNGIKILKAFDKEFKKQTT